VLHDIDDVLAGAGIDPDNLDDERDGGDPVPADVLPAQDALYGPLWSVRSSGRRGSAPAPRATTSAARPARIDVTRRSVAQA